MESLLQAHMYGTDTWVKNMYVIAKHIFVALLQAHIYEISMCMLSQGISSSPVQPKDVLAVVARGVLARL